VNEQARPAPPPRGAPDATEVNETWRATPDSRAGLRGWLEQLLARLLGRQLDAQRAFNAAQVRLDNELLRQLDERQAATHRHYDGLLGALGRRQDEADERHRQLEQELLVYVRDLVQRIDLVLVETNRGRHAQADALDDLRARLQRLEQALGAPRG
jgi:hypothetical protein